MTLRPETYSHTPITNEEVRRQLKRILGFPGFQASGRRRDMLAYVVEEALAGRASGIKATTIAMAVFDRGGDFDQQSDPVVRLEARKLRRDLDTYYADAGRGDSIRISIPKGRYVPKFEALTAPDPTGNSPSVQEIPAVPPESEAGVADVQLSQEGATSPRRRRFAVVAVAVLALAAVAIGAIYRAEDKATTGPDIPVAGASILIEGFESRGTDELTSLLAAGLAQEIAAALLKFPDLSVHLEPTGPSQPQAVRSRPNTQFVVTGTVWQQDDTLLVSTTLKRNEDQKVLWSKRYSEGPENRSITEIQDEISSQIATVVGQSYGRPLNEARTLALSHSATSSLDAYACVARAQIYRRTIRTEEYQAARDCLENAVREDPDYARAWAVLAYLRMDAARFGYDDTLAEGEKFVPAREAAMRALSLAPKDIDALRALSHIEYYEGDFDSSIDYAQQAVEANPNDPDALANLAYRLGTRNRFEEAVPLMERAIARSVQPVPFYYHIIAMNHMMRGDWEDMLEAANHSVADGSSVSYALLAIAHGALGNETAARKNLDRMAERWPLLAEDPKAAFELHNVESEIIEEIVSGLEQAGLKKN